jgi:putative phosphoesterase
MPYTSPSINACRALDKGFADNDPPGWKNVRMSARLLFLADTHVPKRARALPEAVWDAVGTADVVFHAGDWVSADLLDELQQRAARLVGVYGNNDGEALRARLPEVARVRLEGVRFAMVHETGQARGREARADELFPDEDVLVFGHSHIPWDTVTPRGLRLLNPGSPTDRRRQPFCTYLTAVADAGRLREVELVALPRAR